VVAACRASFPGAPRAASAGEHAPPRTVLLGMVELEGRRGYGVTPADRACTGNDPPDLRSLPDTAGEPADWK
jgi:hypothetical protein